MVLGGTGSEQGGTGCQHDELSENIWFAWSKSSNYLIFEEGKSDYGQTDTHTHRHTEFPIVDSTPSAEGVDLKSLRYDIFSHVTLYPPENNR